jgi:hypothetical protein
MPSRTVEQANNVGATPVFAASHNGHLSRLSEVPGRAQGVQAKSQNFARVVARAQT